MKTLVTISTSLLILLNAASAQFSENFEQNITGLTGNCWTMSGINYTTTPGDVITGNGSAYTNPPTSSSGTRTLQTPFLNVNSSSLSVSFKYKVSSKISGNATRTIEIVLIDKNGVVTSLQVITMDKNSPTTVLTHSATYTVAATGVYRLGLSIGGANGDGNSRVIFDDLNVSASPYYNVNGSSCNPVATAINDSYTSGTVSTVSGNVMLNDQLPADGDTYSAVLVSAPSTGSLVLNSNGSFSYTPAAGFTGGTIVFSYNITDNGYGASASNTATVSLIFPAPATLPIKLLSFNAAIDGSLVTISWKVDMNEDGEYFEIQKSTDGQTFLSLKKVLALHTGGVTAYESYDANVEKSAYYRIKIVNKDNSISYSRVVLIKTAETTGITEVRIQNNPATLNVNFTYESPLQATSMIRMYSIAGVKLYEQKTISSRGLNKSSISLQNVPAGTYVLQVDNKAVAKFVKR